MNGSGNNVRGATAYAPAVSAEASSVRWLLDDLVASVPGVEDAIVVSSDGLLLADSRDGARSGDLSAVVCGLVGLAAGLSRALERGGLRRLMTTMDQGNLVAMAISDGSCLGVYASLRCDLNVLGYQMSLLVERAGHALTPQVRSELHRAMAVR